MLLTGVGIEGDGGVESLAMLQDIERQHDVVTLTLLLDPQQCALQVQPEADFLQRCS